MEDQLYQSAHLGAEVTAADQLEANWHSASSKMGSLISPSQMHAGLTAETTKAAPCVQTGMPSTEQDEGSIRR